MPGRSAPYFVDKQCLPLEFAPEETTSSTSFVDIPGAVLTTNDLGEDGFYNIWFSILVSASLNNTEIAFRSMVNGVPTSTDGRGINIKTKDLEVGYTLMTCATIPAGSTIQAQWKTDQGTATLDHLDIIFEGAAVSRVLT